MDFRLRRAASHDIPELETLIEQSGRELSVPWYTREQADAITREVFGVDSQLIADGTFFVVESGTRIVACGGWSRRRTLFGGDRAKTGTDPLLDPGTEAARIRAFFVDPAVARRGLAKRLLAECTKEAAGAGFRSLELVSTAPGEPLYLASGFVVTERFDLHLAGGIDVPLSRMIRQLSLAEDDERQLEDGSRRSVSALRR